MRQACPPGIITLSSGVLNVIPHSAAINSTGVSMRLSQLICSQNLVEGVRQFVVRFGIMEHCTTIAEVDRPCVYKLRAISDSVTVDIAQHFDAASPPSTFDLSFTMRTLDASLDAFMELELQGEPRVIVSLSLIKGETGGAQQEAGDHARPALAGFVLQASRNGERSLPVAGRYLADGRWHRVNVRITGRALELWTHQREARFVDLITTPLSKWRFKR